MSTPSPARTWVDPPPVDPYLYGLLSVTQVTTGGGTWQVGGVEYDTDACAHGGYVPGSCPYPLPGAPVSSVVTATPGDGESVTFTLPSGAGVPPALWALVPTGGGEVIKGTVSPGTPLEVSVPAGSYLFQAQFFGYPSDVVNDLLTVPGGEPVEATVTASGGGGTSHDKPVAEGLNHVDSPGPFTVYARAECNAVGFNEPVGIARRRIPMIENREVEHYFARYVLGAVGARLPYGATALPIKQAVGALQSDAALHYGGAPVFHAPRWSNNYFEDRNILQSNKDTNPVRRTRLHERIAFGGGYYNNPFDPAVDPPAGQFWLVATGSVRAWRSEIFVNETFTEATNLRTAIAERTYLFDVDCYRAAVLVDLTGEG